MLPSAFCVGCNRLQRTKPKLLMYKNINNLQEAAYPATFFYSFAHHQQAYLEVSWLFLYKLGTLMPQHYTCHHFIAGNFMVFRELTQLCPTYVCCCQQFTTSTSATFVHHLCQQNIRSQRAIYMQLAINQLTLTQNSNQLPLFAGYNMVTSLF